MGKYNFDEIIDRHGTSCNKWEYNIPEDVVPMWVADMDFAAAPEIREAMQKRLDHPVYGYTHHSKELKDGSIPASNFIAPTCQKTDGTHVRELEAD